MSRPDDDTDDGRRGKVARLVDQYDLDGLGAELERLWTAEDTDERRSLRDLAAQFNHELLRAAMAQADMQPLDGEVENTYRLLTNDDVDTADRTRTRRELERAGIDVDQVIDDFVSYQAIRTYLRDDRGAEYDPDTGDRAGDILETIQRLRSRTSTVTSDRLAQLRRTGALSLGDFRVLVGVRVVCEDCGTQYEIAELLDEGGCECS